MRILNISMKLSKQLKIPKPNKLTSALVSSAGVLMAVKKSPDEALGQLFHDVQAGQVYGDGKTFVDLIPKKRMKQINQEYMLARQDPNFDLKEFVKRHFYEFEFTKKSYDPNPELPVRDHIRNLWSVLERRNRKDRGSLIALPHKYIVPGGRFAEQFYWDSYFVMLGLVADKRWDLVEMMMKNYTYMIRKFGFIPTANRTYFLSRSQPPFFSHMVKLLAQHRGNRRTLAEYLPYMLAEHRFWMKGSGRLDEQEFKSFARVVKMPDGSLLNRYYDNKSTPRPESLREDVETSSGAFNRAADRVHLHLRAGAESGWDFSSRWFDDPSDITTIHTADIIPVDLNCLIYHLEMTIAQAYRLILQPRLAKRYQQKAERRAKAIEKYCWDENEGFYFDYNFHQQTSTRHLTLAGAFPLYVKIANSKQAAKVAEKLERDFLKPGGLVMTMYDNGQQWDAPNGWAPLQWTSIQGLRSYGFHRLSDEIKKRWTATNIGIYRRDGKLIEKYNVVDPHKLGGGGEYEVQDGFGWTNGVLAALLEEDTN